MRTREWTTAAVAATGLAGIIGCGDHGGGEPPGIGERTVYVTFLYLPSQEHAEITATPESTIVKRTNAADSVLSQTRAANTPEAKAHYDSLRACVERVKPGEYRKENVLDGTRIWLRHRDKSIYCDNCLNDYVLRAAGAGSAAGAPPSGSAEIKEAVAQVTAMVIAAERHRARMPRRAEIVIDKSKMKDSTRAYELDTSSR